ncbi:helix-turn-helix transcriptional regulator [Glaesserella parasuis]|uniref:helix-turn-helix transcriptional regulator n=1 Tax=Glaesserella parasuis TaxID=738 RepID=UPI0024372B0E|nr:helix-turn-helix domain-containing protein [Glaesserella parasuis]MDG6831991.1 helix-turn-helix domain-containing protein [Glaesserella parasuis]MDP0344080.1 helix-turn-helix domain-containing protein [Glaesserella parasuis]
MENVARIEEHYTIKELIALLKISRTTIDKHVKEGRLQKIKMGKRTLFSASEINRFLQSQQAKH